MKGIDALTHVVADPGEGAVKLIIGFFKLLGVIGRLLTSKSPAANVAGLLLGLLLFGGFCGWLLRVGSGSHRKKGGRRTRRARSTQRKKDEEAALGASRPEPSGRPSSTPEPEATEARAPASREPVSAERPVRISVTASPPEQGETQSEEDAESAGTGGEREDERGASRR